MTAKASGLPPVSADRRKMGLGGRPELQSGSGAKAFLQLTNLAAEVMTHKALIPQ